jgi:hypothetical protein
MPLQAVNDRQPIHDQSGFRFDMSDGRNVIGCLMREEALHELSSGAIPNLRTAFEVFRADIEAAASRKFDRGEFGKDGIIPIDFEDLWEKL